jgi:hypothetical protein
LNLKTNIILPIRAGENIFIHLIMQSDRGIDYVRIIFPAIAQNPIKDGPRLLLAN